jgi:hypothetical protein
MAFKPFDPNQVTRRTGCVHSNLGSNWGTGMLEDHLLRPFSGARSTPRNRKRAVSAQHAPRQNQLLAALPLADYERLVPDLELVPLPMARSIHRVDDRENTCTSLPRASLPSSM